MRVALVLCAVLSLPGLQAQVRPSPEVRQFLKIDAPLVALVHARVVDGTGSPAQEDQTLILRDGRIEAMGASSAVTAPKGAQVVDLTGHTVLPGLVGMHNHLF